MLKLNNKSWKEGLNGCEKIIEAVAYFDSKLDAISTIGYRRTRLLLTSINKFLPYFMLGTVGYWVHRPVASHKSELGSNHKVLQKSVRSDMYRIERETISKPENDKNM